MIAQVEVANPGFEDALAALTQIGGAIDQAIRRTTSLGPPRADPGVFGVVETASAQEAVYSVPAPPSIVPALPGLDQLQALSRGIAEALKATLLPTLDGISRSISECCAKIGQAIGDACKCTGVPTEITKAVERIERSIGELADFGWGDFLKYALPIASLIGVIAAGVVTYFALTVSAPVAAALAAIAALALGFGGFGLYKLFESDSPEDIDKSTDEMLDDARTMDQNPVRELHPRIRPYAPEQRLRTLRSHIREFESKLERLREIIEDPEAETDSRKHTLRKDAERILPSVRSKFEELLRIYESLSKEPPALDLDLQDWLRGLDKQDDGPPPVGPGYDPEAVPAPGPISSLPPGTAPASFVASQGVPLERLMELVLARLTEPVRLDPVRLEVRVLDDRVIARRLDGNRGVDVDFSRGPRLVGYIAI